ncbi:hypothetical protein FJV77_21175 [Mesorhizobium sp. WSM4306]|nr:hypothetical protein [Mesorhizobium sp. WSM4306]TRC93658.1 hypothetical protein FJV77_21175 [Mesorhizobium sp. WSM4306]
MSDIGTGIGSEIPQSTGATPRGVADWLCLAAAPTFAVMALLTCIHTGDGVVSCLGANASLLTSMPVMYLLMSAFHLAPWLRVISGRPVRQ